MSEVVGRCVPGVSTAKIYCNTQDPSGNPVARLGNSSLHEYSCVTDNRNLNFGLH